MTVGKHAPLLVDEKLNGRACAPCLGGRLAAVAGLANQPKVRETLRAHYRSFVLLKGIRVRPVYREPTDVERTFLRLVCQGQPELVQQVACCTIADYDPTGWCDVNVRGGPPSPLRFHADGPSVRRSGGEPPNLFVQTILAVNEAGYLKSVEIITYGFEVADPYTLFIDAAGQGELIYPPGTAS